MDNEIIEIRHKIGGLLKQRFLFLEKYYGHKTHTGAFTEIVNRLYEIVKGEEQT